MVLSSAQAVDLDLTLLLESHHYTERGGDRDWNEDHHGVGITIHENKKFFHTIMAYENSLGRDSVSYMVTRKIGCKGIVCFGGAFAVASGYNGPGGLAAAPFLVISFGPVKTLHLPGAVSAYGLSIPIRRD